MSLLSRCCLAAAVLGACSSLAEDVYVRGFGDDAPVLKRNVEPERLEVERWEAWCFRRHDGRRRRWGIITAPTLARLNQEVAAAHRSDDEFERWIGKRPELNYDDLQTPIAVLQLPKKPPRRLTVREALEQARRELADKVRDMVMNAKTDFERSAVGKALNDLKQLDDALSRLDTLFSTGPANERTYRDVTSGVEDVRARMGKVGPSDANAGPTPLPQPEPDTGAACCVPELTWAQCPEGETLVDCLGFDTRTLPAGCKAQGEDRFCCPGEHTGPRCP